jgi:hypothetical protein
MTGTRPEASNLHYEDNQLIFSNQTTFRSRTSKLS